MAPIHVFSAFVLEPGPRTQEQPGTPPPVKTFPLQADITRMQKVVEAAKREADIVIIAGHWGLAVFLASVHAGYITGATINVDGGKFHSIV